MQSNQGTTWKVRKQEESPLLLPLPPITDTKVQFAEHILHTCSGRTPPNKLSEKAKHMTSQLKLFLKLKSVKKKKVCMSQEETGCTGVDST